MEQNPTPTKKTAKDEEIILQTWLNRDDPMIIATHQQVDADAAFSAALLRVIKPNAAVVFVRADSIISQPEVIAVDLMNGESAVKGLGVGSAFGLVVSTLKQSDPSFYKVLKPWAKQLNLTDQAKRCNDSVVLADMVSAWRSIGLDDKTIVSRAGELLLGKLKFILRRERQKTKASKIQIQGGVAVLGPDDHVPAKQLFQRGAKGCRSSRNGWYGRNLVSSSTRKRNFSIRLGILAHRTVVHSPRWISCELWWSKGPKRPGRIWSDTQIIGETNAETNQGGQTMTGKTLYPDTKQGHEYR